MRAIFGQCPREVRQVALRFVQRESQRMKLVVEVSQSAVETADQRASRAGVCHGIAGVERDTVDVGHEPPAASRPSIRK